MVGEAHMIEVHRRVFKASLGIVLAAAAAFLPFDRTVSLGLLLGIGSYYVYLHVLTATVTLQLNAASGRSVSFPLGYLLRMAILALPLFMAVRHPEYLNVFAAFASLMVNHIMTFVLYGRKESVA